MFGYLQGKLVDITPSRTYLEVNGVGYEVQLTLNTFEAIQSKEHCLLYTHLHIREDAWTIYGFFTEREKEAFQKLLTISGVGAATARILLSSLRPEELAMIVNNGDSAALQKVKGIGAKTAQRIILELKGKLPEDLLEFTGPVHNTTEKDALNALMGLGIAKAAAEAALKKTTKAAGEKNHTVEELIKAALKNL